MWWSYKYANRIVHVSVFVVDVWDGLDECEINPAWNVVPVHAWYRGLWSNHLNFGLFIKQIYCITWRTVPVVLTNFMICLVCLDSFWSLECSMKQHRIPFIVFKLNWYWLVDLNDKTLFCCLEMWWETGVVKTAKKTQILWLVDITYWELENMKIRHQVYVHLLHSFSISKYSKVFRFHYYTWVI